MIITKLQGGLGNQMFQYAAGKALSLYHKVELRLDTSSLYINTSEINSSRSFELRQFKGISEIEINEVNRNTYKQFPFLKEKILQKLLPTYKRDVYKEKKYHYDKNFFNGQKHQYLKGYWQSELYFSKYKKEIVSAFQIKDEIINNVKPLIVKHKDLRTLAIHIRRGDYLRNPEIVEWHGVLTKDYYLKAFTLLQEKAKIDKVLFFSDDPAWVEKELIPIISGENVSNLLSTNQYEDFFLMQHCTHNIIANSSFSWWAAYLNPNPNKIVVAPKNWFNKAPYDTKDLYPQNWLKV